MKKTQFIDLISTIKKTRASFIVITVFITLGLAFYGGSTWSVKHTEDSFVQTYKDCRMQTLLVTDGLGITEDQLSELKAIDGIDDAEGFNIVYRFFELGDGEKQLSAVVHLTENINKPMNIEGNLPTGAGQAAVLRSWANEYDIKIGDKITLQSENGADYRELRAVRDIACFDGDDFTNLDIKDDDSGYLTDMDLTVTAIVDSPVYLSTNPSAHGLCPINGFYIDAVFFVSEEEMPTDAFGGYTSVALFSDELSNINAFSEEYRSRSQVLGEKVQSVLDKWDNQLIEDFSSTADRLRLQLDDLYDNYGMSSPDGEDMYELLDDMRLELNDIDRFSNVNETQDNSSFLTADNLIGVLGSLRTMMGITFLAIGILICYSVVSRLVSDGAASIGTRKALGFFSGEIRRFYIYYVGAAVLLGGILGVLIGVFGIELALTNVFASQFTFSKIPLVFRIADILPVFAVLCLIIFAVTIAACRAETQKSAIELLRGTNNGKHKNNFIVKSRIFQKLSLLNQTVILNLFRDKRRVFGMITGIAGAAALITAGLTFYLNFTNSFSTQFDDYFLYDYQVCFNSSSETASEEIRGILESHDLDYAEICCSFMIMYTPDGKTNAPTIIVPKDADSLCDVMFFDSDTEKGDIYDGGVWMGEYYRYAFDAPVGSELKLKTLDGTQASVSIDRYYKHHLSTPSVIIDAETYKDTFGDDAVPNSFLVNSDGVDIETLISQLEEIDGYAYTINTYDSCLASFSSEKMVVTAFAVLFIAMAILMALMTIINLLNVYISEKKNELIILMINGYDRKFVKSYIYQDTIVLTVLGILVGLIAGSILGDRALIAVEGTSIRVIHGISWISCILASVFTAILTALICRHTLKRVDSFKMSDISAGI